MAGGHDITVGEIAAMLNQRVEQLAPELVPGCKRVGKFLQASSVDGGAGQSLKINLQGHRGRYTDFSAAEGTPAYSGDMLTLLALNRFGGTSKEALAKAIAWAKSYLGLDEMDPARLATVKREVTAKARKVAAEAEAQRERNHYSAWTMWRDADPIARTPAESYLETRGITLRALGKAPGALRYRPDIWCPVRRAKFPAMLAAIVRDGSHVGTHRTYLDIADWSHRDKSGPVRVVKMRDAKGRLKSHKLSLGEYLGGHIPLWKGEHPVTLAKAPVGSAVYISEGIEDGLTVALAKPDARVIAGVALANMGGLITPDDIGPLIFIGQNDASDSKATEAFERAVQRQQEAGRRVQTFFPSPEFKDFNDQLLGKTLQSGTLERGA